MRMECSTESLAKVGIELSEIDVAAADDADYLKERNYGGSSCFTL